ncbi:MAG: hypothetical protein IKU55_06020, partial [Clostridia bacterium]|nr:hypothetical protein [Clostridia bacterium]
MTGQYAYISGCGREDYLKLIDDSFAMLHPCSHLPYLQMLYNPNWNTFREGFIWGNGFWMQNSYGFIYGAVPFLQGKWKEVMQNSLDLFWNNMGDGKRIGSSTGKPTEPACYNFIGPDGALGDCVCDQGIAYRQGDGQYDRYDWFYEATACGILLQCEILLFSRDKDAIAHYIPLLKRSMEHIELTRAENGLFLVGPAANLLAPAYGGSDNPIMGKSYLSGLAVTYGAALRKFAEVAKLAGDNQLAELCTKRYELTYSALPQNLTDEGYLVKSIDPDGTKHGVYGAEKHGYLEGVANMDAIAHRMVDEKTRASIYRKIASVEGIRPYKVLCNNYPSMDDTPDHQLGETIRPHDFIYGGNWVNGGCWSTVEGRAIIAYMDSGHPDDAFAAADYYMRWNADYRMDQPLTQWGKNEQNYWQKENEDHSVIKYPVGVMLDGFGPVTGLLRSLFSYVASAEGLALKVNLPQSITDYTQKEPFFYGGCRVALRVANGSATPVAYCNGVRVAEGMELFLPIELFGKEAIEIFIDCRNEGYAPVALASNAEAPETELTALPQDLQEIYREYSCEDSELAHTVCAMVYVAAERRKLPFDVENFR